MKGKVKLKNMGISRENFIRKFLSVVIGTAISSFSIVFILRPNEMIPGGVSGISVLLDTFLNLPIGLIVFLLNLPLFILGIFFLNAEFIIFSGLSMLTLSFYIGFFDSIKPDDFAITNNMILACIYGGIINGIGAGLTFLNGTSTGGFDIVAAICKKYYNISVGNILLLTNILIIGISARIYSVDKALFTLIALSITYKVIDEMQLGVGRQKQVFIISSRYKEITEEIREEVKRGVTFINGKGSYLEKDLQIIYLICSARQLVKVINIVKEKDKGAFVAVSNTVEILGNGFKHIEF